MNFDCIERRLSRWYSHVEEDGTVYYADNNGKTVATKTGKLIVMYFACSPDIIWNHRDMVAVAVAKDFVLTNEYQKTVADIVSVMGLCGSHNAFARIGNQLLISDATPTSCFDDVPPINLVEPFEIVNRGIMDSAQFSTCNLKGALIDVLVRDATGAIKSVPYIVGKGIVSSSRRIGTLGNVTANMVFHFDKGMELIVPKELYNFDFDNIAYGLLSKKTTRRRKKHPQFIEPKDYTVYSYLRTEEDWYWSEGSSNVSAPNKREQITYTKYGTNYHLCCKVHFR